MYIKSLADSNMILTIVTFQSKEIYTKLESKFDIWRMSLKATSLEAPFLCQSCERSKKLNNLFITFLIHKNSLILYF